MTHMACGDPHFSLCGVAGTAQTWDANRCTCVECLRRHARRLLQQLADQTVLLNAARNEVARRDREINDYVLNKGSAT